MRFNTPILQPSNCQIASTSQFRSHCVSSDGTAMAISGFGCATGPIASGAIWGAIWGATWGTGGARGSDATGGTAGTGGTSTTSPLGTCVSPSPQASENEGQGMSRNVKDRVGRVRGASGFTRD